MAGLSNEQQENVWALWAKGESIRLTARTIGVSQTPVRTLLHRHGGVKPPPRARNRRWSLTWDRGREMACHDQIHALGMQVFFCDARSPCQRGTNENTNRLLRQYLAKNAAYAPSPRPTSTPSPRESTNGSAKWRVLAIPATPCSSGSCGDRVVG